VPFDWISGNPKKNGHNIYDKIIGDESKLFHAKVAAVIVAVSSPSAKTTIEKNLENLQSVYYFC
jgi:hypothetical protein